MSRIFKYTAAFFIGMIQVSVGFSQVRDVDSVKVISSISSEKILQNKTIWGDSENAAGLYFFDIRNKVAKTYINYHYEDGEYRRFQDEREQKKIGFYTNGFVQFENWKFYGDFNYFNQKNAGVKFVDVCNPYNYNPYILGDSVGGTYHKEFFIMSGKGAMKINEKLTFGFGLKYRAGVGARRKDPRPKNVTTDFDISPALVWNLPNSKIGAHFRYVGSKEDVELETVTDSTYNFLHFKGLGAFTSSIEEDKRSSVANLFGGGLQYNIIGQNLDVLTEVNFYKKTTDIKRGESFPLQIVLLEHYNTSASATFMFKAVDKVNKLKLHFDDKHIYGHEPVVEPKLEQHSYQWETLAKYTLYWHQQQQYGVNYSHYKLVDANHFLWGGSLGAKVLTSEVEYYFVPEKNAQKLNYYEIDGLIEREVLSGVNNFVFSLEGTYRKGFNSSFSTVKETGLSENVNAQFVEHDFEFYNQQLIKLGGEIQYGRDMNIYKSPVQLYIAAEYKKLFSNMSGDRDRDIINIKLGINY